VLLRGALFDARFAALFELEVYGAIVGAFELNNLGARAARAGDAGAARCYVIRACREPRVRNVSPARSSARVCAAAQEVCVALTYP